MIHLYYSPGACSMASHISLEEAGVPYQAHAVDFDKGEGETPEFLKLSPMGVVPVIKMTNEEPLTEGSAILQYIGDQAPKSGLTPSAGTIERYRLQETLNFIATEVHKGFSPFFGMKYFGVDEKAMETLRTFFVKKLGTTFDILEKRLSKSQYLMGSQFTVADAYLFTVLSWAPYVNLDLSKWTAIGAFLKRVGARPAVQKVLKAEGLLD